MIIKGEIITSHMCVTIGIECNKSFCQLQLQLKLHDTLCAANRFSAGQIDFCFIHLQYFF